MEHSDDSGPRSGEGSADEDSDDDLESEEGEAAVVKPYSLLLQSLASSNDANQRTPKRRKVHHSQTEDDNESLLEDEIDLADEAEGEAEGGGAEEEIADLDSDNEEQSDPFESHFVNPPASRLSDIGPASKGDWKDIKLLKSGLSGNAYFSIPAGSEATAPSGSKLEGLKDLRLKKRLMASEELTRLQKVLGQFVFEYVDVLYGERTLDNAEELRKMYSLHALNHVLK